MLPKQYMHFYLSWVTESLLLKQPFRISRGSKTHAKVIVLKVEVGGYSGWAEAVPYARYNETIESTEAILSDVAAVLYTFEAPSPMDLADKLHEYVTSNVRASSAKNLLDCALWDLKTKIKGVNIHQLLGTQEVKHAISAQTLSVDKLEKMLDDARAMAHLPLIKIKVDANDVVGKMQAIHKACPTSQFIIDANEAWSFAILQEVVPQLVNLNVVLIEQPLAAGHDVGLIHFASPIPLCADESCHTSANIDELASKYDMVNIKLDKSGGLTEALILANAAKKANLQIMLGCMVASSLAMAPIFMLANMADFIDLDGPILVAQDRPHGFLFDGGHMQKPEHFLWGHG